jgi:hypothetical protein
VLHIRGPIFSGFLELFQVVAVGARGDILRSVALMMGASRLLVIAKDIGGIRPIAVGKVFFRLISCSIILQLEGPFYKHLSPISLEFRPLEVVRPSFLASKPFSTYICLGRDAF